MKKKLIFWRNMVIAIPYIFVRGGYTMARQFYRENIKEFKEEQEKLAQ